MYPSPYDSDGLRVCSICRDRETTSEVCWSCRNQLAIDDYDFEGWEMDDTEILHEIESEDEQN